MHTDYFGLKESPFALSPDPRFLYMSRRHQEALAHLLYGMGEAGGFVQLTGEVGTGKTTLCRSLLEQAPENVDVALIFNPRQTAIELVASICDELRVSYPPDAESLKVLVDLLNEHLLTAHAEGRRTVLVIDEAQNLSPDVLEQVRLLTNLETTTNKLLQILLIGQPELRDLMARPELRQLSQRITARYHLTPLSSEETSAYIRHRLEKAGRTRPLFSSKALRLAHKLAGGVPRLINIICDRALLGAHAGRKERVKGSLVKRAAAEVSGETHERDRRRGLFGLAAACIVVAVGLAAWLHQPWTMLEHRVAAEKTIAPRSEPAPTQATEPTKIKEKPAEPPPPPPAPKAQIKASIKEPTGEQEEKEKDNLMGLAELLREDALQTGTDDAFTTLFDYWGVRYLEQEGKTACERAVSGGLRCLHDKGNWTTLARYNLPVVLELIDESRRLHDAVLSRLDPAEATLDFAGRQITLPKAGVEPLWFGSFILVWKPPKLGSNLMRKGVSGPDVLWLKARLDHAEGLPPADPDTARSSVFDAALEKRVMDFQRDRGLKPDGVVGEQTLLRLAVDPSTPTLSGVR